MTPHSTDLRNALKRTIVDSLMLQIRPEDLADDQSLFGPGSLGLDSVDALQLVVVLEKDYNFKICDTETARKVLGSVGSIAAAIEDGPPSGVEAR
jgi:acyl carrier protein